MAQPAISLDSKLRIEETQQYFVSVEAKLMEDDEPRVVSVRRAHLLKLKPEDESKIAALLTDEDPDHKYFSLASCCRLFWFFSEISLFCVDFLCRI